jgi:hypothetical protein
MFRHLQRIYETEQIVSGSGTFGLLVPDKDPGRRYYVYINRILLGVAGLNVTLTDPFHRLIDKFVEMYWTENVFTVDKHFINEIIVVSTADEDGNLPILLIEYSERNDSADISPKGFFIAVYGEIREGDKNVIPVTVP